MQIIDDITRMLNEWQPDPTWTQSFRERKTTNYYKILLAWEDVLNTEGEYEVAYRLEKQATTIRELTKKLINESNSKDEENVNMAWLLEILFGRSLTATEADWYSETSMSKAMDSLRGENSIG